MPGPSALATLPQILCIHDNQGNMRNAAAPYNMTYSSPVLSQANITGVENTHDAIAAGFQLHLAGQEDGKVVDNLRVPIDATIFPTHKT